jgi:Leucine-rich repeat (LRR) protein
MKLHPDKIKDNLNKIGKKEGLALLRDLIDSASDPRVRQSALINYGKIEEGKNFKFFEHLFLSDENLKIRLIAGQILKDKYFNNKKFISLLEYTINKVNNVELKLFSVRTLNLLNNTKTRKILIDYLKDLIKEKLSKEFNRIRSAIENYSPKDALSESILEIYINLILNEYYSKECGYHVTLRGGKIYTLNCESSNLNKVSDILGLESLITLEHLQLERNKLESIDGIQFLTTLRTLDLSYNNLEKIQNLETLTNLEELNLSNNKIQKIQSLDSLPNLKKLFLNDNRIKEIDNLASLGNLEELNLSHNQILEIKNLDKLEKLKRLNLANNQIKQMKGLKYLINLMWLYLNDNKLTQISGLSSLDNLKGLYLSNNLIEKIEGLNNLLNLKKIELSNNWIEKIEGLSTLTNLQELYLDNNKVTVLEGLEGLNSLIMLHLGRNQISKFHSETLESLKNLNFLFLNENPLDTKSWEQFRKIIKYP